MFGVKLLPCCPCGLNADCGGIRGDLRAYLELWLVLGGLVGERAVLGLK